ncbi:MAG: hypothetical protein U0235_28565 [Polyangiaceae bacterium]
MHTARTSLGTLIAAVVTASFGCGGSTQSEATGAPGPSSDGGTLDGSPANDASGGRDGGTRPGFTPVDCTKGSGLGALTAAPAFDYVELRQENGTPSSTTETVLDKVGTLCAKATDVPACKTKFAAIQHPYPIMCSVPYCSSPRYLAYTRGDEVASIEEGKSLAGLVAPIDSAAEALFVLGWTSPYGCAGSAYRASGDGFDVSYSYETECPNPGAGTRHDVVVHVGRDGTVTVLEDATTPPPPSPVGCAARGARPTFTSSCPTASTRTRGSTARRGSRPRASAPSLGSPASSRRTARHARSWRASPQRHATKGGTRDFSAARRARGDGEGAQDAAVRSAAHRRRARERRRRAYA